MQCVLLQVFGVTWNSHISTPSRVTFATWGKKHCKLWHQSAAPAGGSGPAWTATGISFGAYDVQHVHSAAFLPKSNALALGLARGEMLVVQGTQAVRSIAAHKPGPQIIAADGSVTYGGVRGMALHEDGAVLLSAGGHCRKLTLCVCACSDTLASAARMSYCIDSRLR